MGGQDQVVKDGVAVQAGGDVHLHAGPSVADVRDLVEIIMHGHLPSLRAEAAATAQRTASQFFDEFMRQAAASQKVSAAEFAKPDAQAVFQEGLTGAAIKGADADLELVVAAMIRRLEAADDPLLMKQVLDVTVPMLPKLSRPQISFLAFVHFAKRLTLKQAKSIDEVESLARTIMPAVVGGLELSAPNLQYLAGIGAITINPIADAPLWLGEMRKQYSFLPPGGIAELRSAGCSMLALALERYEALDVPTVFPTLPGTAIGVLQLRRVIPGLDLSIWIQ